MLLANKFLFLIGWVFACESFSGFLIHVISIAKLIYFNLSLPPKPFFAELLAYYDEISLSSKSFGIELSALIFIFGYNVVYDELKSLFEVNASLLVCFKG